MYATPAQPRTDTRATLLWIMAAVAFTTALGVADVAAIHSRLFALNPALGAAAVAFDLGLAVPFGYYILVIRRTSVPAATVFAVATLGLFAAGLMLPATLHTPVHALRLAWLVAALAVAARTIVRAAALYRACAQAARDTGDDADVLALLRASLRAILPVRAAADAVAYEVAVLYYALAPWARVADEDGRAAAFSYHRHTGITAVLAAALAISFVETAVVHLLLHRAHPTAAMVMTVLSIYGIVWLLGFLRSVRLRPVLLTTDALHVRLGLLWDVRIPYAQIATVVVPRRAADERAPDYLRVVAIGDPQFIVELTSPLVVTKPYGLGRREVRRVGLALDDKVSFEAALRARLAAG